MRIFPLGVLLVFLPSCIKHIEPLLQSTTVTSIHYSSRHENLVGSFEKVAVIVEPRKHPGLLVVVKNVLRNLDPSWKVQIFHGTENETWVEKEFSDQIASGRLYLTRMDVKNLTLLDYNTLMLTPQFWENILGEHVLLFELDSALCDHSIHKIEEFMSYDYIGAPWTFEEDSMRCDIYVSKADPSKRYVVMQEDLASVRAMKKNGFERVFSHDVSHSVGNSGLSLRSKKKTLQLLDEYIPFSPHFKWRSNDVFYSCVTDDSASHSKKPSFNIASTFSVETVLTPSPLGFHKAWGALSKEEETKLGKICPDYAKVKELYMGKK